MGGEWRSRRLPIIDAPGLRPTSDRVRETLFNWLQGHVQGAVCLDAFAGSGALGFEALSRGAAKVVWVERQVAAARQLQESIELLKPERESAELITGDVLGYLNAVEGAAFDLVFLDPPFRQGLVSQVLDALMSAQCLAANALVYLEHESEISFDWAQWNLIAKKEQCSGQVTGWLLSAERV